MPLDEFFLGPDDSLTEETALEPGQLLAGVRLSPPVPGARSLYLKATERRATDVALVSAKAPTLQIFHNEIGANMMRNPQRPRMIGLRFVGGNDTDQPSAGHAGADPPSLG